MVCEERTRVAKIKYIFMCNNLNYKCARARSYTLLLLHTHTRTHTSIAPEKIAAIISLYLLFVTFSMQNLSIYQDDYAYLIGDKDVYIKGIYLISPISLLCR